jgi:hypothetical protein
MSTQNSILLAQNTLVNASYVQLSVLTSAYRVPILLSTLGLYRYSGPGLIGTIRVARQKLMTNAVNR